MLLTLKYVSLSYKINWRKEKMGGKGSGRKPIHNDEYHKVMRNIQWKYDHELRAIAHEHNCSLPEARKIRGDKRRKKLEKEEVK